MKSLLLAFLVLSATTSSAADRIQSMSHPEQCVYRARLASAGSFIRQTKAANTCSEIKIMWHGNETQNETDYVTRWICAGFTHGTNPVTAGDATFDACMKESDI